MYKRRLNMNGNVFEECLYASECISLQLRLTRDLFATSYIRVVSLLELINCALHPGALWLFSQNQPTRLLNTIDLISDLYATRIALRPHDLMPQST